MAEICQICNKKIGFLDMEFQTQGLVMHYHCLITFEENPEKYGVKAEDLNHLSDQAVERKKRDKKRKKMYTNQLCQLQN